MVGVGGALVGWAGAVLRLGLDNNDDKYPLRSILYHPNFRVTYGATGPTYLNSDKLYYRVAYQMIRNGL